MKKLIKSIVICFAALGFVACEKDDAVVAAAPVKPYGEVVPGEVVEIEKFLGEYHMEQIDGEIEFVKKTDVKKPLIENVNLKFKTINFNGYDFKVYYINLNANRQGELKADEIKSPCPMDSVLVKYRGVLLRKKSDFKDTSSFVENQTFDKNTSLKWFSLDGVVAGWTKMVSQMTTGVKDPVGADNVLGYNDFDDVVMFLPSGLGYYNNSVLNIPSYSPLVFHIKLMDVKRKDHDGDTFTSRYENFKFDSKVTDNPWVLLGVNSTNLDTDGDGFPDFFDQDDDNDGVKTRDEKLGDDDNDGKPNHLDRDSKERKK